MLSIEEKIKGLIGVNERNSEKFIKDELPRRVYQAEHKTNIMALKCMDGRVNLSVATGTPLGIIKPYRNIGGRFNLGWPMLGADIQDAIESGVSLAKRTIVLINYHYSEGDKHRGCAGFGYDKEASMKFTLNLHDQFNRVFGKNNGVVYPIVLGLETDTDALIFHAEDPSSEKVLFVTEDLNTGEDYILSVINGLYPNMDRKTQKDIVPLIQGNVAHIKKVRESNRNFDDMKHKEWVLGVGRGFDWLHEPNTALLVGPFNPELSAPISKAVGIIKDNMDSGRINDDGFLILSSAIFMKAGNDKNRAIEKTNFFAQKAKEVIEENYPEMLSKVHFMRVVVDENTRKIEQVSEINSGL